MDTATRRLQEMLCAARFEVLPVKGAVRQCEQLPPGTTVTVTSSAAKGQDVTLATAERLAGIGMRAVPHLAARSVVDSAHLAELLDRLFRFPDVDHTERAVGHGAGYVGDQARHRPVTGRVETLRVQALAEPVVLLFAQAHLVNENDRHVYLQ